MSAAAKRTMLAAVSVALLGAVTLAGAAGGAPSGMRDRIPPTPPANIHVTSATPSVVSTAWDPSQDDVGVAGYYVYHDTGRAKVSSPAYTVGGLDCGYSTAISVAAFDQSGNRSPRVSATIATAACPDVQPPTTPSGFRQAATTQNAVVLEWGVSTDNVGVVAYGVYRNLALIASPADPTLTLTGLACSSTYTYTVDAADAAGNRSLLGTAYVQTAACSDGQPPTAPTDLAVTAKTQTSISISWSPSSDNVGVAGYHVRRGGSLVSTGTQTSSTISSLACGVTYTIGVDAFDAAGNQSPPATTSVATDACTPPPPPPPTDTTPPSQPSGLAVSATGPTSVSLSWAASSDDVGVSGYGVYVNGSSVSSVTQLAATVSNLTCATAYSFAVDAYDAAGNRSSRATLSAASASCSTPPPPPPPADTTPPSKPILALGPQTQTSLELDWQAATDNVGIDHYNVWLGHSGSSDFAKIAQTPATQLSYVYQGLACATAYTLGLEAVDAAGNKSLIAEATWGPVSTLACSAPPPPPPPTGDTSPPSPPANLALQSATKTSVSLTWAASSDNVGVSGYGTYLNSVAGATSTQPGATVSGLSCGTAYTFEVDAYDAAGNHSARASVIGSTAACADMQPPSAPANLVAGTRTATSIALSWSASSDNVGVTGYGLYRGGTLTGTTAATNGIFSGLTCNTNYTLAVDAYDAAANHSTQTVVMVSTTACPDTSPPSTPSALAASGVSQTGLTLTWNASSDNVGVTGYDVYQGSTKMATVTSTSSSQTGLACGTSYAFAVVARDAAGNSSPQAQLNASTSACSAPPPPPPSGANLYISPSGNDANACTQTAPCRSFDRAYRAAAPGSTVEVAGGSYPDQNVRSDGRPASSGYVVFRPAAGAQVAVSRLDDGASRVEFRDMAVARFYVDGAGIRYGSGTQNGVVLRNLDADTFCVSGGTDVEIIGGDVGPSLSSSANGQMQPCVAKFPGQTTPAPSNVLIEGVAFHDHNQADGMHTECLQIGGVSGLSVRRSTFRSCAATASIHIGRYDAAWPSRDVVIENNFFLTNTGASSEPLGNIQYNRSEPGLVIRYNSFAGSGGYAILATFDFYAPASPGAQIYGNASYVPGHSQPDSYGPCDSYAVYHHNVWRGASCSSTDLNADPKFVSLLDLHLQLGSPAIGRGDSTNFPATDIDGDPRPSGGATDSGADER